MTLQEAMQRLSAFSMEDRCADVCPGCGLHMLSDLGARLAWLAEGGEAKCVGCGLTKTREVARENATTATYEVPTTQGPDGGLQATPEATARPQVEDPWLAAMNKVTEGT